MTRLTDRGFRGAVAAVASGVGLLFFVSGYPGLIYDSFGYAELARRVSHGGLSGPYLEIRTYGYPLFVALVTGFQAVDDETLRLIVCVAQLLLYVAACALGARRLGAIYGSPKYERVAFVATALNPFLLARATETLTDSLSAVLVYLGILWCVPTASSTPEPGSPRARREAGLSLLFLSLATMVRPSNVAVLLAALLIWAIRQGLRRELRARAAPVLLAAIVLPFLPQVAANYRASGRIQPLVLHSIYGDLAGWGIGAVKYGTLVIPGEQPQIVYRNPLYRNEPSPRAFLRARPLAYAATVALHLFAMVDQDFLFTYIQDRHPWYRWPLSVLNYTFLFLCLAGIARFLWSRPAAGLRDPETFAGFAFLLASSASIVLYLPTLVESRFSAPVYLLLTPFFVQAIFSLQLSVAGDRRRLVAWTFACAVFVVACVRLSAFITAQAPVLLP